MIRPLLRDDGRLAGWSLECAGSEYVIALFRDRYLATYHWGGPIHPEPSLEIASAPPQPFGVVEDPSSSPFSLNRLPQEYPWGRGGDFRSPAFIADFREGAGGAEGTGTGAGAGAGAGAGEDARTPRAARGSGPLLDLEFRSWRILAGAPDLGGLPFLRDEAGELESLELELEDPLSGLALVLCYTPVPGAPALLRAARFVNRGALSIELSRAFSFSLDLPLPAAGLELIATEGAWASERQYARRPLGLGRSEIGSRRGVSGHGSSPAIVLAESGAGEDRGRAWGASLLWSGDWVLAAERNEEGHCRLQGGLHPEFFSWTLKPGDSFATPAALLAYSEEGLNGLSAAFHSVARGLMPPAWRDRERPVLLNSWEAAYFDYDEARLLSIAKGAAELGVELFVLDDGWFGKRNDDRSSLGDWTENPAKLPGGLARLAEGVHGLGLGFGIWMEPEMVSADSELFRAHPDWCLALPGRLPSEGRNQRLLDLSRAEVADHVEAQLRRVLSSCRIDYLKWDFNRPLARVGSADPAMPDGELRFRWFRKLYGMLGRLVADFPGILFEGCAGGGGRMDFGMLPFFPQFWASDNTDPVWRLGIQRASSLLFPPLAIGAHVSASPNHQSGRVSSLRARSLVAMGGLYGLELDPASLTMVEKAALSADIAWYRERRSLLQLGELLRLEGNLEWGDVAWAMLAPDRSRAIAFWCRPRHRPGAGSATLALRGLGETLLHRVVSPDLPAWSRLLSGAEIARRGFEFPLPGPSLGEAQALVFEIIAQPGPG
ncbi:MAG TPA: alpha-galactosidase [Rectinemataceae bacterium]|nr:alpha-galactosidase [Rectinemataceae bacterium]